MITLMFAGPVLGQKMVPSPEDLYRSNEYMLAGDYQEALPVLLICGQKDFTGPISSYKIGECYLNLKGFKNQCHSTSEGCFTKCFQIIFRLLTDENLLP